MFLFLAGRLDVSAARDPGQLPYGLRRISDVLQHVGANDKIERSISKWKSLDIPDDERSVRHSLDSVPFRRIAQELLAKDIRPRRRAPAGPDVQY